MPTLRADRVAASYVYYDAQTDDARLTLADRAHRGRLRRRGRELHATSSASRRAPTAACSGARVVADGQTIDVRADARRERDRRVVRRRPRARRGHAPVVDPAGQGRAHHGAVVAGAERDRGGDPGAEGPALGVRRAVGRRGRRPPLHLHRHDRHRLRRPDRRPADHPRRRRVPARARSTPRSRPRSPSPTSSARGPACGRSCARATSERTADLSRRHSVRTSDERRDHRHRRQAHDLPPHGRRHGRRRREATRHRRPAPQPHQAASACTAPPAGTRPSSRPTSRRATAATPARCSRSSRADPTLAEPIVPGLAYSKAEVVYAVRAEMARTVDDVLSRRTRARLLARDASAAAAPRGRGAHGGRARLERRRARPPGRAVPGADRRPSAPRAACPRPRSTRSTQPPVVVFRLHADEPGRADASDRVRGRRGRRRAAGSTDARASRSTTRCASSSPRPAPTSRRAAAEISEASRDWWPLAMIWALDDQVDGPRVGDRAAALDRPRSRPCCALCNEARVPVTAAAGRSGVCGASVPVFGGVLLDLTALDGHRRRRPRRRCSSTCSPARSATCSRTSCAPSTASRAGTGRSRWRCRPSAAGSRAAAPASSRPATARSRTSSPASTSCSPTARVVTTGGAPRAAVGPDLTQLFVGSEGTLGVIVGARLRAAPAPARRDPRRVRVHVVHRRPRRDAPHRAARRDARGAAPLRRDRSRPQLPDRRRARAARDGRGRRAHRRRDAPHRRRGVRGGRRASTSASSSAGWSTATTCRRSKRSSAAASSSTRWRSRRRGARCPRSTSSATAAIRGVEHTMVASAHQSHSYTDGACLYFTFAGKPPEADREALLPRRVGRRASARCSPRAARSATTTASA